MFLLRRNPVTLCSGGGGTVFTSEVRYEYQTRRACLMEAMITKLQRSLFLTLSMKFVRSFSLSDSSSVVL